MIEQQVTIRFTTPAVTQLVVFVLDGSASMTWPGVSGERKADEVLNAVLWLINEYKNNPQLESVNRAICAQFIAFSSYEQVKVILDDFTPLRDVDTELIKPPTDYWAPDGTCIYRAMEKAREAIERFVKLKNLDPTNMHQSTVILLSDGCETFDRGRLIQISKEIATNRDLAVVQYGRIEGKKENPNESQVCPEILKSIASKIDEDRYERAKAKLKDLNITEEDMKTIFVDGKLYTHALREAAIRVFFMGATTYSRYASRRYAETSR